jgi:hypothetical protein
MPVIPGTGPLQVIHLDDVVGAIVHFLNPSAPSRVALDLVGPRRFAFDDLVRLFRRWMRWRKAWPVRLAPAVAGLGYKLGDAASLLGWRPPIRTTARVEVRRGAIGDIEPLRRAGFEPHDVEAALFAEPASVQERWFAKLYVIKPLLFLIFALFWIGTGLISLGPGWPIGIALMQAGGVAPPWDALVVIAGALADIAIGLAIACRRTSRYGLWAALAISVAYAIIGTALVPRLWADPLGPMLKIWPIMVLNLVALAILEDR